MVTNESFESITVVIGEVTLQVMENVVALWHLEHHPTSIEILDRNGREPFVVIGPEDLGSPADVVAMNAQRSVREASDFQETSSSVSQHHPQLLRIAVHDDMNVRRPA